MLAQYAELIPIALVGALSGFMCILDSKDLSVGIKGALRRILVSSFLCALTYAILSTTELPYLARVGISACVAFLGFERAISYVKEFLEMRKGGRRCD